MWIFLTKDEYLAIQEIQETKSDRATAIVAAAIVEERLTAAIKSKLHRDKTIVNHIFRTSGPLGSFSAKIDLGFLIGLYSKEAHSDFEIIKDVRNEFAHRVHAISFSSPRIYDLCKNFKKHDMNFQIARVSGVKYPRGFKSQKMFRELDEQNPTYVKEKYVRACQVVVVALSLFIRKRKPPSPNF